MADRVFVSPGVYTSENDISFVTRQVGVTTLGLVGETTIGPAFQPIFVSNYDEFKSFFGGLNATKIKDTGAPKYELPYIAKSYMSQSNQLFVTRVLGLSGYNAGLAWGITLKGGIDVNRVTQTASSTDAALITYVINTNGTKTITSTDAVVQGLITKGLLDKQLAFITGAVVGTTATVDTVYDFSAAPYIGASMTLKVESITNTTGAITVVLSGTAINYSAEADASVEGKLVSLLRSRAYYDGNEILNFDVDTSSGISIDAANSKGDDPKGNFVINGISKRTNKPFSYNLSFDKTKKNYITRVLGRNAQDNTTSLYVEEIFENMLADLVASNKVAGINLTLVNYNDAFKNYKTEYSPAVTPWVVSELRGTNLLKLFRLWTISDGNAANKQFKVSIKNIKLDDRLFDVEIRAYGDSDAKPVVLERFTRCSMNPNSNNYIAKKIGTVNGDFQSKSNYVLVELEEESNTADAFPAGFVGFPTRKYDEGNPNVKPPNMDYKKSYGAFDNKRKFYLGLSETKGIDQDFFDFKGLPSDPNMSVLTGMTKGFHMDVNANTATIDNVEITINSNGDKYSPEFKFETGNAEFRTENGLLNTDYEKVYARKFTFAPYGGFDGWDVFRTRRTNTDNYTVNASKGQLGLNAGNFKARSLDNGDRATNSDYYAYLEAIWTFKNPESTNINVFATPGIDTFDNTNLVEDTIEMIEQDRADSIYIVTTPDTDASGDILTPDSVVSTLDDQFDSNYTATYYPWVQVNDAENNVLVYMPPTRDVVRNIALTDNIAFPWFAAAGIQRGDVKAVKARKKLTQVERDTLYSGRINPILTIASEGIKIMGNKTLQERESALNRINVRRLLLQARKLISAVSVRLLFEQNDAVVRNQFLSLVNPILDNIRAERGLTDFRVVLDVTPESIDRNELCGRIFIKPTRALEFICVEFNVMNTGATFDDI